MNKWRTGQYFVKSGRPYFRLRTADSRPSFPIALEPGPEAQARAAEIAALVHELRRHEQSDEIVMQLVERAALATTPEFFEAVRIVVRDLCENTFEAEAGLTSATTFDELFDRWVKNELHALYPDHVRRMKEGTASDYASLYRTYVKNVLGHLPIGGITQDHAFRAMREVPAAASSNSLRRNTGIVIARPLRLAVFPLRILEKSPIPDGFLPRKNKGRAKVYLYPSEDAQLLGHREIDLVLRLFYGLLAREGLRVNELARLEISDFDLENGILVLDENKTDEPRQWAMADGTVEALRVYVDHFHPCPRPNARMFLTVPHEHDPAYVTDILRFWVSRGVGVNAIAAKLGVSGATVSFVINGHQRPGPRVLEHFSEALADPVLPPAPKPPRERSDGKPLASLARATELRDNLRRAGLKRPQLFELTDARRHIVIHDLRATFVTVSLAEGKSEAWITDRTGHTSSSMLYKYKRAARTHQERALGSLTPLVLAIPELGELANKSVWTPSWTPSPGVGELTPPESPAPPPTYTSPAVVHLGLQRLDSNHPRGALHVA